MTRPAAQPRFVDDRVRSSAFGLSTGVDPLRRTR